MFILVMHLWILRYLIILLWVFNRVGFCIILSIILGLALCFIVGLLAVVWLVPVPVNDLALIYFILFIVSIS